jgi:hypothetical protein
MTGRQTDELGVRTVLTETLLAPGTSSRRSEIEIEIVSQ